MKPLLISLALLVSARGADPLHTTFYDWAALPFVATQSGSHAPVIDGRTATFARFAAHVSTLNPGAAAHPGTPGSHAEEEAILFRSGAGEVTLNGSRHPVHAGSVVFLAPNTRHNIANTGSEPLTYYVVDVYPSGNPPSDRAGILAATVFDPDAISPVKTKLGSRRSFVAAPTATLVQFESHNTTLDAGRDTGTNTDPADEVIVITQGLADVTVKGVTARLVAGSFYFQAAGDEHSIHNVGSGPCSYQVLKFVSQPAG